MAEDRDRRPERLYGRFLIALGFAVVASFAAMGLHHAGGVVGDYLWRGELVTYDWRARLAHPSPISDEIVIVTIDDESIGQFGVWPWFRSKHAHLIERLSAAGAKLICFDVEFSEVSADAATEEPEAPAEAGEGFWYEPKPSKYDLQFRDAIREAGNVVLASRISREERESEEMEAAVVSGVFPYWEFEDAARGVAPINIPTDSDSTVRRAWLWLEHQDVRYPTFCALIAALMRADEPLQFAEAAAVEAQADHSYLGLDGFLIDYRGPPGKAFTRVPYYQVVEQLVPESTFEDKVVLVGATAESLQDLWQTPMTAWRGGREAMAQPMPGVEIHAHAIETLLSESYVRPIPLRTSWALAFLLALLCAVFTARMRPLWGAVSSVISGLLFALVAFSFYFLDRLWLPIVGPVVGAAVSYSGTTIYMYVMEERQRLRIKRAWQQRVSSEVLSVILDNPGLTQVLGKRIDATCLFTDLRGFTDMCHALEPEQVVQRLNEYLTEMTRIIQEHGGVIHKFIGDGIMAVFGDPVAYTDHAARAVRAAVAMQRAIAGLRDAAQAEGQEPLHMRIGIHTGPLVAGDIGSADFLEYTVIGATVSIASRLEGLNKDFGTDIIIGKATRDAAGDEFRLTALGEAEVRGVPEPVEVFAVSWDGDGEQVAAGQEAAAPAQTAEASHPPPAE